MLNYNYSGDIITIKLVAYRLLILTTSKKALDHYLVFPV